MSTLDTASTEARGAVSGRYERQDYAGVHSPEFQPDLDGMYPTSSGLTRTRAGAWRIYDEQGPDPVTAKARNAVVRRLLAARWPGVKFYVRHGSARRAFISWCDGPTARAVEDHLWVSEDLTPAQARHCEYERLVTGRGVCLAFLRDRGEWLGAVDLTPVELGPAGEEEEHLARSLARLCGHDPDGVALREEELVARVRFYGPALLATTL